MVKEKMKEHIKPLLILAVIFLVVDLLWLKFVVGDLWKTNVETVQKSPMEIKSHYAILSYLLLIFGTYYFVYLTIDKENYVKESLIKGFISGFIIYGVFDFTNLAIFKEFDLRTAIIDMLWGGTLTAGALVLTNKLVQ
jgi:uncharacterized membrane protein